jgi:Domain of unknown function (DUF4920)
MKTTLGLLSLVATIGMTTTAWAEHYGAPITLKNPVTLEAAVAQLDGAAAADVLVESKVDKVCAAQGCWLGLKSGSSQLHVTFKNEAFFVPQSLIGKTVVVEGKLAKVPMTLEQTRAVVKAGGGDPQTVKEPRVQYELVASGIEVKG